jgi:hypothetical protein
MRSVIFKSRDSLRPSVWPKIGEPGRDRDGDGNKLTLFLLLSVLYCRWVGYIKEYDGGTLMECYIHPGVNFLNISGVRPHTLLSFFSSLS